MTVVVERVVVADAEVLEAVRRLVPQLSETAPAPDAYDVETVVNAPATTLLVARSEGTIVGMLTVAIFRLPTGLRAWIEDVVVDADARRLGAGRALVEHAVGLATDAGARSIDLTSRPERTSARELYESLGFVTRATSVFRRSLE
jgi:ribosomal protein S18 acetylase RimI-like enzyme